jgi:hypothetical protein
MSIRSIRLFSFCGLAALGCVQSGGVGTGRDDGADESGEDGEDGSDDLIAAGTCAAWKVSYCGAVEHCGSAREARECEDNVGHVRCLAAAPYPSCQEQLDTVVSDDECDDWPKDCEPRDIADRTEPSAACKQLHAQKCEWLLYCGSQTSIETCESTLEAAEPCSAFTAVLPAAEDCIERFLTLQCDESVPSECATEQILRK